MRGLKAQLLCGILTCAACGDDDGGSSEPGSTYHADVRPLIDAYCVRCHTNDGFAPFALETTDNVLQYKELVVESVETEYMPLDDECPDFEGSFTLSTEQRAVFTKWQDNEFALGNEADYEPLARRCLTAPDKEP